MRRTGELCLLALLFSMGVWAQAGAGSGAVTGTVLEAAGDGLPDATVVLSNAALGLRRVMATSDDGVFDARALIPSAGYRIKITRKGFMDWDSGEFEVAVGRTVEFQIDLNHPDLNHADESGKEGNTTTSPPRVLETKNGITTLVSAQQMDSLPSRDRRLDPLVLIAPLTSTDHRSGRLVFTGEPSSNLFLTDGVGDHRHLQWGPAWIGKPVLAGDHPGVPGAHGQLFGRVRLGAGRNCQRGHAQRLEPFSRRRLRVFHQPLAGRGQPLRTRAKPAAAPKPGRRHAGRTHPARPRLLLQQFRSAGRPGPGVEPHHQPDHRGCRGTHHPGRQLQGDRDPMRAGNPVHPAANERADAAFGTLGQRMAKVDYRRSERNSFSILGNAANTRAPGGGGIEEVAANGGLLGLNNTDRHVHYGKAAWTSAPTPNTLSEIRFGIFDDRIFDPASSAGLSTGNTAITVAGATVGNPRPNSSTLSERRYQLTGNFTATSNTHSFTAGRGLVEHTRHHRFALRGRVRLSVADRVRAGFCQRRQELHELPPAIGHLAASAAGAAIQPLRIRHLEALREPHPAGRSAVRKAAAATAQPGQHELLSDGLDRLSQYRLRPAHQRGVPGERPDGGAGGLWLVLRAHPRPLLDALFLGNGVYQSDLLVTPNLTGAPVFPNVFPNGVAASSIPAASTNLMYASSKLRNPYVRETTAAIETRLDRKTTLTISALHSRGFKRWTVSDVNLAAPTVTKTYAIDNAAGQQTDSYSTLIWNTRNDSRYGHIYSVVNGGSSWYNAGVAELRRSMSSGLTVQATYTWSHAITDTGGPTVAGFLPLNANNGDVASERANSPLDQRHRGVVNWTWQPTQRFLRGWAVSGIATMASGQPETAVVAVAGQQFSGVTMAYTNSLNGSGGWARVPFDPIGSLHTGPQYNVDARISRTINLREGVRAVLMFEAFNAFNTQFDTAVNTIAFTATPTTPPTGAVNGPATGILRPVPGLGTGIAAGPARQCQVALRITF